MIKKGLFYFTMFISALGLSSTAIAYDNDLWARLIVGKLFFQNGYILKNDFLSYTPTHTWWDHEWGASIIFYSIQQVFGHFGFILLHAVLLFLTFYLIVKIIKLRNINIPLHNIVFFFIALNTFYISVKSPVRCQMFSFLFFALFIYILEKFRMTNNKKLLFFIPAITLFWANVHGGVISGIGLLLLYAIGQFLNKKPFKPFLLTLIASFLVMFVNPYGIEYVLFLFYANTMPRPLIIEWWNLFHPIIWKNYLWFDFWTLATSITAAISLVKVKFKNVDFTKYVVTIVTFILAITHVKLIPLAVITSCAFFYEDLISLLGNVKLNKFTECTVYFLIILTFLTSFNSTMFKPILTWAIYPLKEVEFIKLNNLKGNLFTSFGIGSFVSYKLYPDNKIYMDGRYEEVYYNDALKTMETFYLLKPNWRDMFKKYPPDILLLEKMYPAYTHIEKLTDWVKIYDGAIGGVFVRKNNLKKNYISPSNDLEYYRKHLFETEVTYSE